MPEEPSPKFSQLRSDRLSAQLQTRLDQARGTRDRLRSLLEAVLSLGPALELDTALQQIVESAAALVDARYGALGVVGDDRKLTNFLFTGVTAAQVTAIGPFPSGHGVPGGLLSQPEPLHLLDLTADPASVGFPTHHPPMHDFLGTPIRIRNEIVGNLYLTEKHGGTPFDAEDESVLRVLAAAAGVAIDHARLHRTAWVRDRWLQASSRITCRLLSGTPEQNVLGDLVRACLEILAADLGAIAVPLPTPGHGLFVQYAEGLDAEEHRGLLLPLEGTFLGAAFTGGRTATSTDVSQDPRIITGLPRWQGFGPAVAAPLGSGTCQPRGVLLIARRTGGHPFTPEETTPLQAFADHAALALEIASRRRAAEEP
ncbi:GAF domain-containing protein [Streptacidiphilus rugosus]|uniref:GAF domain-containing protein n=1 Tax=Streptacidiphilus rugosus TaxID=405783 RepID=UPI00068E65D3|nr:GAF domain-containing protein [Streptacidiphilus rugosus]